jgi:hypothetical protein
VFDSSIILSFETLVFRLFGVGRATAGLGRFGLGIQGRTAVFSARLQV